MIKVIGSVFFIILVVETAHGAQTALGTVGTTCLACVASM